MDVDARRGPLRYLAEVPDPRAANARHLLLDLLVMTLLAVLCRCEDYEEISTWAKAREDWLKTYLRLPHGVPHADTFERVFRRLAPEALERCFIAFTQELARASGGRLVAVDGKSLRGSFDQAGRVQPVHMVNAWDRTNGLVLGQLATDSDSNEISAVPQLLELLDLRGAVVSLDAMHCQKQTAQTIVDQKADYLLAVKDNQKTLKEDIELLFTEGVEQGWDQVHLSATKDVDAGHGRLEKRQLWASGDVQWLKPQGHDWPHLKGIIRVDSQRHCFDECRTTTTTRYYLTSLDPRKIKPKQLLDMVRGHWTVENQLHWSMDVTFAEDQSRVRKDHGPQNMARIRRLALNLLKRNPPKGKYGSPSVPVSLKRRRMLCSLNDNYLLETLTATNCQMR